MAKLKINVRNRETNAIVTGSVINEYVKINAMIERVAEAKEWSAQSVTDYLDSGRALWIASEDGKLVREIYFTN